MKTALVIPSNWPAAWWSAGGDLVRMACPACGHFSLYFDRTSGKPKLECRECHITGFGAVTAAFDVWRASNQPDEIELSVRERGYVKYKD